MTNASSHPLDLPADVFSEEAVPEAARLLNAEILDRLTASPDMWQFPAHVIRQMRREGGGAFPPGPPDPDATEIRIPGPAGEIPIRVIRPRSRPEQGCYLHIHGGGWVIGEPVESDRRLRALAEATGLATLSVDYRLAPEAPYPAGPDDCEAAALWLLSDAAADYSRDFLAIGGESAGAHLSAVTLLRLRDRHETSPFGAALLTAGCYDLGMTPSVRGWGTARLILNTRDIENFVANFLQNGEDVRDGDVSPLQARLAGMPPALFTCGTRDLLLDDTLFMASRWLAAGNVAETAIYPGGCHVFQGFESEQAADSLARMHAFLARRMTQAARA